MDDKNFNNTFNFEIFHNLVNSGNECKLLERGKLDNGRTKALQVLVEEKFGRFSKHNMNDNGNIKFIL